MSRFSATLALVFAASSAFAQQAANTTGTAATTATPGVSSGSLLQAVLGIAFMFALLLGAAWLARRYTPGQRNAGNLLKVLGAVSVGPRERVVLVEVDDSWLVLGVAPGQVRTLHTLPKKDLPDGVSQFEGKSFAHWLKQVMDKKSTTEQDNVKAS